MIFPFPGKYMSLWIISWSHSSWSMSSTSLCSATTMAQSQHTHSLTHSLTHTHTHAHTLHNGPLQYHSKCRIQSPNTWAGVIQVFTCMPVVKAVGCYLISPLASLHSAQGFSHINWDQQVLLVGAVGLTCSFQTTSKNHGTLDH